MDLIASYQSHIQQTLATALLALSLHHLTRHILFSRFYQHYRFFRNDYQRLKPNYKSFMENSSRHEYVVISNLNCQLNTQLFPKHLKYIKDHHAEGIINTSYDESSPDFDAEIINQNQTYKIKCTF